MTFGRHTGGKKPRFGAAAALTAAAALFIGGCDFEHDQLLLDLQSDREEIRATAIKKISEDPWPNDDAILFQAASDSSALVRIAAVEALYMSDDPRVQDLLAGLLEDKLPELQRMAVQGLLRKPTPKNLAYLRNAYVRGGWMIRRIIGEFASADQIQTFLQREAESIWNNVVSDFDQGIPSRQETASILAAESGREEVVPMLMGLLESPSAPIPVISGAGRGLLSLGHTEAAVVLLRILDTEKQPAVRAAALEALGNLRVEASSTAASRKLVSQVIEEISKIASSGSPDSEIAFETLAKLAASKDEILFSIAGEALCKQLFSSSPSNAESRIAIVSAAGTRCGLRELREDLKLEGTAARSALQILARFPDVSLSDAVVAAFKTEDQEIMAAAWKAIGPLAPSDKAASEATRLALDQYFENAARSHEKWIPEATIHGIWPEDLFEEMKPSAHDHHGGNHDEKALTAEDFRGGNASLDEQSIRRMVDSYNAHVEKNKANRQGLEKLMERLDKAAKERSEALGLKPGTDTAKAFAYHRRDIIPDETPEKEDVFAGMLSALGYMPDYPVSEKFLKMLWESAEYRVSVCELAGSRFELLEDQASDSAPSVQPAAGGAEGKQNKVRNSADDAESEASEDEQAFRSGNSLPSEQPDSGEGQVQEADAGGTGASGDEAGNDDKSAQILEMESQGLSANEIVRRCLRSRIPEDQSAVLRGLIRRGNRTTPAIFEALKERTELRGPLVSALIKLGAADQLVSWAKDRLSAGGDDGAAALAVARTSKDASLIPELIQALNLSVLPDEQRRGIIEVLGEMGGKQPEVLHAVELEIFNNSMEVRAAALQVLKSSGQLESMPKAKAFASDYSARVRQLAGGN